MKRGSEVSLYMMLKCIKQHLSSVHKKVNNNDADLKRRRHCLQKKTCIAIYILQGLVKSLSKELKSLYKKLSV